MALARAHVWNAGDLLTADDLNGEFNNILNNPISLVSPTTGVIDFALQSHTNLTPAAITASSATGGQVLTAIGGVTVWSAPASTSTSGGGSGSPAVFTTMSSGETLIGTSSGAAKSLTIGSTGQILRVTSSNSDPSWGLVPVDGGLSSGTPSTGALYYVSTAGLLLPLSAGLSSQVLTISSGLPVWANSQASTATAPASINPQIPQYFEDFQTVLTSDFDAISTSVTSTNNIVFHADQHFIVRLDGCLSADIAPFGLVNFQSASTGTTVACQPTISPVGARFFASDKIVFQTRWKQFTTAAGQRQIGFTTGVLGTLSTAPSYGVFLLSTAGSTTVLLVSVATSGSTTLSCGVTASSFHSYQIAISSSSVDLTVDNVAVGSITNFVPYSSAMFPTFTYSGVSQAGFTFDFYSILSSGR